MKKKRYKTGEYSYQVQNYFGTPFLESLYANIPTICFYDDKISSFRLRANHFILKFIELGIIHRTPNSAAIKLNELENTMSDWRFRSEIQTLRNEFIAEYAQFSEGWSKNWNAKFEELLQ